MNLLLFARAIKMNLTLNIMFRGHRKLFRTTVEALEVSVMGKACGSQTFEVFLM